MTYRDTFVGRLKSSSFDWADPEARLNSDDIEILTESFLDSDSFNIIQGRISQGDIPNRQLDWGSWAASASQSEILSLMAHWKVGWDLPDPGDVTHKPRLQRARCLEAVQRLPPEGNYVIVIEEF